MTTRHSTAVDSNTWPVWAGGLYLTALVGAQFGGAEPGFELLLVSLLFFALPAAVGGLILMAIWEFIKGIIFE